MEVVTAATYVVAPVHAGSRPATLGRAAIGSVRGRTATATAAAREQRAKVVVAEPLSEAGLQILKESTEVECWYDVGKEELLRRMSNGSACNALIVRSGTRVGRDVFEACNGTLRVVGRAGVGIDNVDVVAATELGCIVVNAPTANTVAAAEHALALLLSMARNVPQANQALKSGKWLRSKYVGVSLVGKTLAVIGLGKVGSEVVRRARGLGMHVIASDPYASRDKAQVIGVELVSFDAAISSAHFISLHMPLTPSTAKIFDDETFSKMKKGVRIVNVARGGVIDEDALIRALDKGIVAQAALDVFTKEPPEKDDKLVQHEKVIVTPHLGASTVEAQDGVAIEIAEAVVGALKGDLSATAVNAPMVPADVITQLSPYVVLAEKLGRMAVQLVTGGVKSVRAVYSAARNVDDLDTRLLRAMITKGLVEPVSTTYVNIINYDYVAKQRGLRITEEKVMQDGSPQEPLESIAVQIAGVDSKFASSVTAGSISVEGRVRSGVPRLTKVGDFTVDCSLEGGIILFRQLDQPGLIGKVGTVLGTRNVNVNYMSVGRTLRGKTAIMAIGVDEEPPQEALSAIASIPGIEEFVFVKL